MGGRALEGCLGTWASWPSFLGRCGFDGARVIFNKAGLLGGLLQGPLPTPLPPREGQVLQFRPRLYSGSPALDAKYAISSGLRWHICPFHMPSEALLCAGHWAGLGTSCESVCSGPACRESGCSLLEAEEEPGTAGEGRGAPRKEASSSPGRCPGRSGI